MPRPMCEEPRAPACVNFDLKLTRRSLVHHTPIPIDLSAARRSSMVMARASPGESAAPALPRKLLPAKRLQSPGTYNHIRVSPRSRTVPRCTLSRFMLLSVIHRIRYVICIRRGRDNTPPVALIKPFPVKDKLAVSNFYANPRRLSCITKRRVKNVSR